MKSRKVVPIIFALAVFALILKSLFEHSVPGYTFPGWAHGAAGYDLAMKEAETKGSPMIVYFHTSWCTWCRKLDNHYLSTDKGEAFLKNIPRVEINPDKGEAEKGLMMKFGLSGYPSFLVLVPKLKISPMLISPFQSSGNLSVDEFLNEIQNAITLAHRNVNTIDNR